MKKLVAGLCLVLSIALTGCTIDAAGSQVAAASDGATENSIPDVVQPAELRDKVYESMKGKRVAFVPLLYKGYKITQQWGVALQRVVEMAGGVFQVYDANFDTDTMIRTINELIQGRKADVLVLHNPDVGVLTQQIESAKAAGIYTVVLNLMSSQTGDAFVGADTVSASKDLTARAAQDCAARGKNKVAIINGPGTNGFDQLFARGVDEGARENGLEVVTETRSNYQVDLASQQATTLVQKYKGDLCAILLPWDVIATAAGKAVNGAVGQGVVAAGDVGVYSLDASSDGCAAVRNGTITALASYDVPGIGSAAAVVVQNLFQLGLTPGSTHTAAFVDHVILDKASVDTITTACYTGE